MTETTLPPSAIGEMLGGYELISLIGRGGMGSVYLARHVKLGRLAAVKILDERFISDEQYVSRFFREARIVNEVRHPNIVDVHDFIETSEPRRVAMVMEYLTGVSLAALIGKRYLRFQQKIDLVRQLGSALSAVHAIGVIHRDLKPENVLVIRPLESDLSVVPSLKVLDFGIAKSTTGAAHLTGPGWLLGTPRYMAPEQVAGEGITTAADIYALGEILFELVSERILFTGAVAEILRTKLRGHVPSLELPAETPHARAVSELTAACLRFDASARPTLAELDAVLATLSGPEDEPVRSISNVALAENFVETANEATSLARREIRHRNLRGIGIAAVLVAGAIFFAARFLSPPPQEPLVVSSGEPEAPVVVAPPPPPPATETVARPEPEPALAREPEPAASPPPAPAKAKTKPHKPAATKPLPAPAPAQAPKESFDVDRDGQPGPIRRDDMSSW